MAICKSCGASVRIGQKCGYCGKIAEPWEYPDRPDIPQVRSTAEFYMAVSEIVNRYMGKPYTEDNIKHLQSDLNNLIYYTDASFVPHDIRVSSVNAGDILLDAMH